MSSHGQLESIPTVWAQSGPLGSHARGCGGAAAPRYCLVALSMGPYWAFRDLFELLLTFLFAVLLTTLPQVGPKARSTGSSRPKAD